MLVFQADRLAAIRAEFGTDGIERAAFVTKDLCRVKRINLYLRTALLTIGTQMLQSFEISAFALPVADLELDIFERCGFAKVRNREDRLKDRLQTYARPLFRNKVHLKKSVVGFPLNLDEIRDLSSSINLGKIHPFRRLAGSASESVGISLKRIINHNIKNGLWKNICCFICR